tara:strand:+ start:2246 stop:2566 length:321 start_codon:yes stop_codon:yes gene_type:complete
MKDIENQFIELESLTDESLSMEMIERKKEMTLLLSKKIVWALENNKDIFIYAFINIDEGRRAIGVKRDAYLEALEKNVTRLEDYEEYELCQKVREWIEYLKIEEIC